MLIFKAMKKKLINSKLVKTLHYITLLLLLGKLKFGIQGEIFNLISRIKCLNSRVYFIFLFGLFKSIPTKRPSLVEPTLNKIDVEALKRDLKKIEEHYPVRVLWAWAQWLQDIEKLLELPNHSQWPLDILKRCPKVQRPGCDKWKYHRSWSFASHAWQRNSWDSTGVCPFSSPSFCFTI